MPGSIFTLITPFTRNSVLFGLFTFVFPVVLYCAWSALAFLDLSQNGTIQRGRVWRWSAAILLLPLVGAAAYLVANPGPSRASRLAVVAGGAAVMLLAFSLTWIRVN